MINDITSRFFIFDETCPAEIPDCENLRKEYILTLDSVRRGGGCGSCAERQMKNSFIARIAAIVQK